MLTQDTGQVTVDKTTCNSVPILNIREVDTTVRVKEGEMVVIGGLIQEKKAEQAVGVPGISSVPRASSFLPVFLSALLGDRTGK